MRVSMMQKSTPGVTPLKSMYIPVTRKNRCEEEEEGEGEYLVLLVKITIFSQSKNTIGRYTLYMKDIVGFDCAQNSITQGRHNGKYL